MLPFLKQRQETNAIGDEDQASMRRPDEESSYDMLDAIADDLLYAFEKKDKSMVKDALEALCEYVRQEDMEQDEEMEQ